MRRTIPALLLLAAVTAAALLLELGSGSSSQYRVAAVFDTANGMVAGQQVKIAGAVVGSVDSVDLEAGGDGYKARIVMSIERRFAPFHTGASCTILPEGLISENFVQCNPGSRGAPLAPGGAEIPTVALSHTTVPFSLQDVLNVLSLPTDERLRVLISELGIGTAGRGAAINALLRRTNPALQKSQQVLHILNAQRTQLAGAVGQTDRVLASIADHDQQLRQFVDRAATVTQTTAQHRDALEQAVARLPAMLTAVRPGLRSLDHAVTQATPLLAELKRSGPGLSQLTSQLPPFAGAGIPALKTLAAAAADGRPAVRDALPVIARLHATTRPLRTLAGGLSQLIVSSRQSGAFEGLLATIYSLANISSLYDNVSHILSFTVNVAPQCIIGQQAGVNVAGCGHDYTAPGGGSLPLNEPSCGPQPQVAWLQSHCPPVAPGPLELTRSASAKTSSALTSELHTALRTALSGGSVPGQTLHQLLGFLLK